MQPINIIDRSQEEFHGRSVIPLTERDVERRETQLPGNGCLGREVCAARE